MSSVTDSRGEARIVTHEGWFLLAHAVVGPHDDDHADSWCGGATAALSCCSTFITTPRFF